MSSQVWLRFEKKKDGTVLKLTIQDLPPERIEEAVELMVKYFLRDEPLRKATGFIKNPEAIEEYRQYKTNTFRDPATRNVMCCTDDDDDTPDIMGISSMAVATAAYWDLSVGKGTEEMKKMNALFSDAVKAFNVMKEYDLPCYYADKSMLVVPDYRGLGIAEKFLTVRRLMCAAHNVPLAGAWLTNYATQIAADRDGWEKSEIDYQKLFQKHNLPIEDVNPPPTMKFVVGRPCSDIPAL